MSEITDKIIHLAMLNAALEAENSALKARIEFLEKISLELARTSLTPPPPKPEAA